MNEIFSEYERKYQFQKPINCLSVSKDGEHSILGM
jgi:hypothetical protein